MKKKYEEFVSSFIKRIGGKKNITSFAHCFTRLRVNVRDKSIVEIDDIKNDPVVAGIQWTSDQLQIILGEGVSEIYDAICDINDLKKEEVINENLDKEPLSLKSIPGKVIEALSSCMIPLLPMLIVVGLLSAISTIIGPSVLKLVSAESDLYTLLSFTSSAGLYFLPLGLAVTGAKRFNCSQSLAILMVSIMLYPSFIERLNNGTPFAILGIPVTAVSYDSQILPIIMVTAVMGIVEKYLKKIIPGSLITTFEPLLTILIMLPLTFCVLGPLGSFVGNGIAKGIMAIYNAVGPVGTGLLGLMWTLMVLGGMHFPIIVVCLGMLFENGVEYVLIPVLCTSGLVWAATDIAWMLVTKDNDEKQFAGTNAVTILLSGLVEPSLYGLYLKHRICLIAASAGMCVGGFLMGLLNVGVTAFTGNGAFMLLGLVGGASGNLVKGIICAIVGAAVAFAIVIFGSKKEVVKIK